jgi:hypothetical protein
MTRVRAVALLLALPVVAAAEPPIVEHQPVPCTIPNKPMSLCASITDDSQVAKARVFFRKTGEKFWYVTDMSFAGMSYCGTVPALRENRAKSLEYYIQGIDDSYDSQRTSTFVMTVQPEAQCDFPPVEKDPARAAAVTVQATDKKQGKKISDDFAPTGVAFVPVN